MTMLTIPKQITGGQDLVVLPRLEYERLLLRVVKTRTWKEFVPTPLQKRDLKKAREEYKHGSFLSLDATKRELGIIR